MSRSPENRAARRADVRSADALDRREASRLLAALCLVPLLGCGEEGLDDADAAAPTPDGAAPDATAEPDAMAEADAGPDPDAALDPDAAPAAGDWASGGTAAMVDKANYPDPFTTAAMACALVATTTEGPCTTETSLDREDVSEGWDGLPVRLGLKVVDTSCSPLAGALVKIWHTNHEGSYSGQTPNNGMCLGDQGYSATDFFRGAQTADADGVVWFDTCYPGWYRGRAVHIHFQVFVDGRSTRVSQIFFPEDVTAQIFAEHPTYSGYGQPDTVFANDNIIGRIAEAEWPTLVLDVARMADGAMLASKVLTVA